MRCSSPILAYENPDGGRPILSRHARLELGREFLLGCGKCLGCQLDRASGWSLRAVNEARYFDRSSFITLSFADEHLPGDPVAARYEFRKFIVRLRRRVDSAIRVFGCMELGERWSRIHGHFCIFNEDFLEGATPIGKSKTGFPMWRSPLLESLWPFGYSWVAKFSAETAAYVGRYCVAKVDQPPTVRLVHPVSGEIADWPTVYKPFYPLAPALGVRFLGEFSEDVWSGLRARGGARVRTPQAYSRVLKRSDPLRYSEAKEERIAAMVGKRDLSEETPERLAVKDECLRARMRQLSERS